MNITLYGTCREDYGRLCRNPDAFDNVVDALAWLQSEGILVHLNTTIAPNNVHRWREIEDFARDRGLELRMTTYCFPPVRREGCPDCAAAHRLPPEIAGEMIVRDMLYREGPEAVLNRANNLDTPLQNTCDLDIGNPIQCAAGRAQLWVTWDGRMTPCGMLSQPAVHPFDQGFVPAWEALKAQVSTIRLCPDCVGCEEQASCMNCAAVTFAETGRFDGKPEYMCRLNHTYRSTLKQFSGSK